MITLAPSLPSCWEENSPRTYYLSYLFVYHCSKLCRTPTPRCMDGEVEKLYNYLSASKLNKIMKGVWNEYWVNQVVGYTTKAEQGLETITTHKEKKIICPKNLNKVCLTSTKLFKMKHRTIVNKLGRIHSMCMK